MNRATVYLDHNATCPVFPAVVDAVSAALLRGGNPSSVHAAGRAARHAVEQARQQVASLVNAGTGSVVFTSGASEANVLALRGLPHDRVLTSTIEHDSVLNAVPDALRIPVDAAGLLDLAALRQMLQPGDLVSVMAVNNETGMIQPLAEIADIVAGIVAGTGAMLHVDAVQAAGRIDLDFRALKPAALSISAHKLGGPPGVGALIFDPALPLAAQTRGGGQERNRRGGTENTAGIVGFGVAAAQAAANREAEQTRLAGLRDQLEADLRDTVADIQIIGADGPRVANTSCIALPGVPAEKQVIALDLAGFAVSAGSACSSGKVKTSHVLRAMGLPDAVAGSAIRISLGWNTTEQEVAGFVAAYRQMAQRLYSGKA